MKNLVKNMVIGIFIGMANVIPGVSGGTMAVVFGVYDKLILLSSLDIAGIKRQWKTFAALFAGLGVGVLLFAKGITILYAHYPVQTNYFFIGLIIASIFAISEKIPVKGVPAGKVFFTVVWGLAALGVMMLVFFAAQRYSTASGAPVMDLSVAVFFWLFVMGVIGAASMLVPGLSGSFILLVLGAYRTVMYAVASFNIPLLIPVGLGVVLGVVVSGRAISFLLARFPSYTYAVILGLIAGSILYLLPQACQPLPMRIASAAALFAGYGLMALFARQEKKEGNNG